KIFVYFIGSIYGEWQRRNVIQLNSCNNGLFSQTFCFTGSWNYVHIQALLPAACQFADEQKNGCTASQADGAICRYEVSGIFAQLFFYFFLRQHQNFTIYLPMKGSRCTSFFSAFMINNANDRNNNVAMTRLNHRLSQAHTSARWVPYIATTITI